MNRTIWVEVAIEHKATGITGVNYVEVDAALVHPEANAKSKEQERLGDEWRVLRARRWTKEGAR